MARGASRVDELELCSASARNGMKETHDVNIGDQVL